MYRGPILVKLCSELVCYILIEAQCCQVSTYFLANLREKNFCVVIYISIFKGFGKEIFHNETELFCRIFCHLATVLKLIHLFFSVQRSSKNKQNCYDLLHNTYKMNTMPNNSRTVQCPVCFLKLAE